MAENLPSLLTTEKTRTVPYHIRVEDFGEIGPKSSRSQRIAAKTSLRFGRICSLPPRSTSASSGLQMGSFDVNGPQLLNSLPPHLQNMTGIETLEFKKELDKFLLTVADEPLSPGYTAGRRAASNSLLHMIPACS